MFGLNPLSVVLWVFGGNTSAACDMHCSVCSYVKVGILPIALFSKFSDFCGGGLLKMKMKYLLLSATYILINTSVFFKQWLTIALASLDFFQKEDILIERVLLLLNYHSTLHS